MGKGKEAHNKGKGGANAGVTGNANGADAQKARIQVLESMVTLGKEPNLVVAAVRQLTAYIEFV